MKLITRWVRAFGLFWWDFLVGDTPELFVATLIIVAVALLLGHHHVSAGYVLLPLVAIVFLVASTYRGRRRVAGNTANDESEGSPTS